MAVFDKTFDRTFTGTPVGVPVVVAPGGPCNTNAVTLMWLSGLSWQFWTFDAYRDTKLTAAPVGSFRRAGLLRDTQRQSQTAYTLRAAGLTEAQSQRLGTLLAAPYVYWLQSDGTTVAPVGVRCESTELAVWRERDRYVDVEITISLPLQYSLRA